MIRDVGIRLFFFPVIGLVIHLDVLQDGPRFAADLSLKVRVIFQCDKHRLGVFDILTANVLVKHPDPGSLNLEFLEELEIRQFQFIYDQ